MKDGSSQTSAELVDSARRTQLAVLAVTGIGSFMTTLGTGLTNVANPSIQAQFSATLGEAGWVVTSYLLAVSALLLVFGRLGDALGYVRLLAVGFVGFACASLLCSSASSFGVLIGGRLLQGVFAAALMAMGPPLITTTFPGAQRGRALGVLGTLTYLGLSLGPVLGGGLVSHFGWRAVFLVHLPIAGTALVLLRLLPSELAPAIAKRKPLDFPSVLVWSAALSGVLYALSSGERQG